VSVRRLVRTDYELQDVADAQGISLEDAARDLALLSVMASLAATFGGRIVFKGGSVLRFGHGATRTSGDTDATVVDPPRTPLEPEGVREAIAAGRMGQFLQLHVPARPRTANKYSLDFDKVAYACAGVRGTLDVELSYREAVVLPPANTTIGEPYLEPFTIGALRPVEMAGEKLRTLAQRDLPTDLADCVLIRDLARDELGLLAKVREAKFALLRDGVGADEVQARIGRLARVYESDIRAVHPSAPSYEEAAEAALELVRHAWP